MHEHRWKRWSRIAFCAALLGGGANINFPALAQSNKIPDKGDFYRTNEGEHPVKLDDFLSAMDKLKVQIDLLVNKIAKDPCINPEKYKQYMLSVMNGLDAVTELLRENYNMHISKNKRNQTYINDKQNDSYLDALIKMDQELFAARKNLKQRACPVGEGDMIPPPTSTAGDDDWGPPEHPNVIHRSTDPYPRRGPGGRPYNWPGGKAYPGTDGPSDEPNPGSSDRPNNWPGGGAYPGPGGGAYPGPGGGGAYPGPGGM
jgi:hypothetical protein